MIYAVCCEIGFDAIYALLCGEKLNQRLRMWRKNDKYCELQVVIVGSAHYTYPCKELDKNCVTLPQCCCVTMGQESCKNDTVKCGNGPVAVEMVGSDAEMICGEWQTGPTLQSVSREKYNVVLSILETVLFPAFDVNKLGPGGGGDIAVIMEDDEDLKNPTRMNRIHPACLPPRDRSAPTSRAHSG